MKDRISHERVKLLHPIISDEVAKIIYTLELCFPENIKIRITQGLRTFQEQDALYAKGRTTKGPKVTNAKAGQSYHNYGLAIDYVIMENDQLEWNHKYNARVVLAFKEAGYKWGGDFKNLSDKPHFEKTFGLHWTELLQRYKDKKFIPNTKYVKIGV